MRNSMVMSDSKQREAYKEKKMPENWGCSSAVNMTDAVCK